MAEEETQLRETSRELPVKLTQDELVGKATKLGKVMQEMDQEANDKSKFLSDWRSKDKHLRETRDELLENVRTQTEQRQVPCLAEMNYIRGTVTIRRKDSNEVVDTRPMSQDERQRSLPDAEETGE